MSRPPLTGPPGSAGAGRLADALRAGAAGLYHPEAASEMLISAGCLHRDNFIRFIRIGTSLTDGVAVCERGLM
jgi:hypothetical protein